MDSGIGEKTTSCSRWRLVTSSGRSCVHSVRNSSSASSLRLTRSLNGTASASNSPSSQPIAAPTISRPPDSTSTLASSLATGIGER